MAAIDRTPTFAVKTGSIAAERYEGRKWKFVVIEISWHVEKLLFFSVRNYGLDLMPLNGVMQKIEHSAREPMTLSLTVGLLPRRRQPKQSSTILAKPRTPSLTVGLLPRPANQILVACVYASVSTRFAPRGNAD